MSSFAPQARQRRVGHGLAALAVTYRPLASLSLDPKNPRRHGDYQVDQLARSIETFGFNVPVLIDADCRVLAGHGRLSAAMRLGLRDVPTITIDHLNEDQRRAFAIADNALAIHAEWDPILLGEQFALLCTADLDFDLTVTGFDLAEIGLHVSVHLARGFQFRFGKSASSIGVDNRVVEQPKVAVNNSVFASVITSCVKHAVHHTKQRRPRKFHDVAAQNLFSHRRDMCEKSIVAAIFLYFSTHISERGPSRSPHQHHLLHHIWSPRFSLCQQSRCNLPRAPKHLPKETSSS